MAPGTSGAPPSSAAADASASSPAPPNGNSFFFFADEAAEAAQGAAAAPPPNSAAGSRFRLDGVFGEGSATSELYDRCVAGLVQSALAGISGTVFAYGQVRYWVMVLGTGTGMRICSYAIGYASGHQCIHTTAPIGCLGCR